MNTTFVSNLKRFRLAKSYTQEQVAEKLGVTAQSVSRWECGITLPDVMLLPAIAKLYGVTVDDLYKSTSVAYANYAQRLASVFEDDRTPENFLRAEQEFRKLFRSGQYSTDDMRTYGIIHHYMMKLCRDKAVETFDKVIAEGVKADDTENIYWRTRHQKMLLYADVGKSEDTIREQLRIIENGSDEPEEWICLVAAYQYAAQYEQAYNWFCKAVERFPSYPSLYIYGGDCCKQLGHINEAFAYWDKALELDSTYLDAWYSKGFYYQECGEYDKAYDVWCRIAEELTHDGYEIEAAYPLRLAEECKRKM